MNNTTASFTENTGVGILPRGTFKGQLIHPDGTPAVGATLVSKIENNRYAYTDIDGVFTIEDIVYASPVSVTYQNKTIEVKANPAKEQIVFPVEQLDEVELNYTKRKPNIWIPLGICALLLVGSVALVAKEEKRNVVKAKL
ncbi:peptidase associated/transthyretin-like domain-containing protein [Aurantibacter aestuarii]|uniref:Carboxypeptidase regulatory-like domain-containing protein n=1 Tax=Aurantibacter aestuarii TaxID=1266046 RepID=A0A2T1NER7_9FLAO|nr:hypothetical protein [Aurantibacter aestuarii]PSG90876.1 hypothetical protein C7H52_06275 [Aurantibacter aestuarii]